MMIKIKTKVFNNDKQAQIQNLRTSELENPIISEIQNITQ